MADHKWPEAGKRSLIGKRITRLDGPIKSSGRAKYSYDVQRPGLLYGKMVLSPHAHAKIVSIDTNAAEKMPGVKAVDTIVAAGKEVLWAGQEIAAVAAETEEQARDAARAVKVEYELLPFFVADAPPERVPDPSRTRQLAEQTEGDVDAGFKEADVTHEGQYGVAVINHCCLESHGQVTEWEGEQLNVWASTQAVYGVSQEMARSMELQGELVQPC